MDLNRMSDQDLQEAEWEIENFLSHTDEADEARADQAAQAEIDYTAIVAELQRRGLQS